MAAVAQGCAVNEPKDGHGGAVMSMDGRYFAKSQEGGAINEPKYGEIRRYPKNQLAGSCVCSSKPLESASSILFLQKS